MCRLPLTGIGRLLDVGCGDGSFAALLGRAFRASELYGVDISERAVRLAQRNDVVANRVDVGRDSLSFQDRYFDLVFAGEILEHLLHPDWLLGEVYRVLAPAGHIIVTTPNLASWYNRIQLLLGYQPYGIPASHIHRGVGALWSKARSKLVYSDFYSPATGLAEGFPHHIRFFTARGARELLRVHGFQTVKTYGTPADEAVFEMPGITRRVVSVFDTLVSNTFASCASRIILVGTKPDADQS